MIEVKCGIKTIDLPYMVQVYDVTEERFDELVDEDTKAEFIDGVMIVHSPASMEHDDLSGFIRTLMRLYADAKEVGKVLGPDSLIHLAPGRKCAPDVFFVRRERMPMPMPKEFSGVPDLIIEVLSPSNRRYDLEDKRLIYREAGAEEVWFLDAEFRRVIVDRRRADGYVEEVVTAGKLSSMMLEGFWVNVSWLWGSPSPNALFCLDEILRRA
jgi:Uma2 family endonuclease